MSSQITVNPALNFNPLSYMQQGAQLRNTQLSNQTAQINNQTLDDLNNARLNYLNQLTRGQDLTNQKQNLLLPYVQSQAEAGLNQTKAQTGLIGAQTGLTGAQTDTQNINNKFIPLTVLGGLLKNAAALNVNNQLKYMTPDFKEAIERGALNGNTSVGNIPIYSPKNVLGPTLDAWTAITNGVNAASQNGRQNTQPNYNSQNLMPGQQSLPAPNMAGLQDKGMSGQPLGGGAVGAISQLAKVLNSGTPMQANMPQSNMQGSTAPSSDIQSLNDQSVAAQQNASASAGLQTKYNYAKNLANTLKTYGNPAVTFSKYMGASGYAQYLKDRAADVPAANNFKSFLDNVGGIGKDQARQFFSSSVQPEAVNEFNELIDPQKLTLSAPAAAKKWDDLYKIIQTEGTTWATSVGKQKEFQNIMPSVTPQTVLQNAASLKQNGENARTYLEAQDPQTQSAINAMMAQRWGKK